MKRLPPLMLLTFALLLTFSGLVHAEGPKKVLVVQSYHVGYVWVDDIDKGVKEALKGTDIQTEFFYMDTKRKPDAAWKKEAGELAKKKVEEFKPDVVITADDNAQEFFAKDYANKAGAPQFVFNGVNAEAAKYGFPAANVTGILERPHVVESVDMFLKIKPDAKNVLFLADNSETMEAVAAYVKTLKPAIPVTVKLVGTFEAWQQEVKAAEGKFDALMFLNYHTIKASADAKQSMDPKEVFAWTRANTKLALIGLMPFNCDDGAMIGIAESGVEHGYLSGVIAKEIIKSGKTAKDFPVSVAKEGLVFVNLDAAKRIDMKVPYAMIKSAKLVVQPK